MVVSYGQENQQQQNNDITKSRPVIFTLGIGSIAGLNYSSITGDDNFNASSGSLAFFGYFKIDLFRYVIINASVSYYTEKIFTHSDNSYIILPDYDINSDFSLTGQFPIKLNRNIILFPLIGVNYSMTIYEKTNLPYYFYYNNDLAEYNRLSLTPGVRMEWNITENLLLKPELSYYFYLYEKYCKENYIDYFIHGPNIVLNMDYSFNKHLKLNTGITYSIRFTRTKYEYSSLDFIWEEETKGIDHELKLFLGISIES